MLSHHVEDLITAIKQKPNSVWKNKALSHAYDTLAAISMLESGDDSIPELKPLKTPANRLRTQDMGSQETLNRFMDMGSIRPGCSCLPGAIDNKCPIHGLMRNIS